MAQRLLERPPEPKPIQGVVPITGRELRFQRRITLVMTLLPFAAFVWAIRSFWGTGISGVDVGVFIAFYAFTGLGITVGFHRLFTHKAFKANRPVRAALAVAGSMAVEGSVLAWTATHRRHHAYADMPGDPHSPHLVTTPGIRGTLQGLWHAHTGWLFDAEGTSQERWVPDLLRDPVLKRIDGWFPRLTLVSFVLPPIIGLAVTWSFWGMVSAFIWGSLVRMFMLHHVTWSINSICHFYGTQPLEAKDESRNNGWFSVLSFGESWHNNHHAFPSAAYLGLRWWQADPGKVLIWTLERLGLARDVRKITAEQYEAKRL